VKELRAKRNNLNVVFKHIFASMVSQLLSATQISKMLKDDAGLHILLKEESKNVSCDDY
jgi:hypothetical protein